MEVMVLVVLAAALVAVGLVAVGGWALVENYALTVVDESLTTPTFATLAATLLVVFVLFALGARSDRWLQNPYW